jgi:antitoxin CptB
MTRCASYWKPAGLARARRPLPHWSFMNRDDRLKRLRYRAWHRGTKEADLLIGGFFDRYGAGWSEAEMDWYEALLEEQDVDIMAWAIGAQPVPPHWDCAMMQALCQVDYIKHPE